MENMDGKERCIASFLKKTILEEGIALYTFVHTIIGFRDEEAGIVIDDQGREFPEIDTLDSVYGPEEFACANVMDLDEAYEKYGSADTDNIQEILDKFDQIESEIYYICKIDENGMAMILRHNYQDAIRTFEEEFRKKTEGKASNPKAKMKVTALAKEPVEKTNKITDNKKSIMPLEKELENSIKSNSYTKDELIQLKKTLNGHKKNIKKLMDIAESKIKDEDYISTIEKKFNTEKIKLEEPEEIKDSYSYNDGVLNIDALLKDIKKTLIAQDEPAKRLLIEIARMDIDNTKKNGILVTGSTGVGKTELMTLISKKLDRPFLIVDTMQITSPGYEGKNIEQCLWELYEKCGKNIDMAEKAIVYFDEIDKKGSEKKNDVSGRAVLNLLLKFLDGTTYKAAPNMQGMGSMVAVDIKTDDMLVIAGGAFTDVYNVKEKRQIGFQDKESRDTKKKPSVNDFVEKAMMTHEFMGRFPVQIRMNDLGLKDMKEIMTKSDKSPTKIEKRRFKSLGVDLNFSDDAYNAIAIEALNKKTGARGLYGIVSEATAQAFYNANKNRKKYKTITITDETLKDNNVYKFETNENTKQKKATI